MSLSLYEPKREDLWFRQRMLADEETMSYNRAWGGTVPFPEADWDAWYDCWVADPRGERFYRYLRDAAGDYVGEIAFHFDGSVRRWEADVIVYAPYRGRGYGAQGLDLLCAAAKERGIPVLYDSIAADNPAAGMFLRRGFSEESRTKMQIILKKEL